MTNPPRLLAKKVGKDELTPHIATLLGHLQSVYEATCAILKASGQSMLQAFGFPLSDGDRFRRIVALSAAAHDVGKANDHFLGMLTRSDLRAAYDYRQALRHEWLSWWWLHQPQVRLWVESVLVEADDWHIVLCCVAGHHPKVGRATPPDYAEGAGTHISFLGSHSDFDQITSWLGNEFDAKLEMESGNTQLKAAPALADDVIAEIQRQVIAVQSYSQNLNRPEKYTWPLLCASAKACLVAADVAGSALSEKTGNIENQKNWIVSTLDAQPSPADIEGLVRERLGPHDERPFQTQVASTDSRVTLVTAGCGCGKTVAAWLWAARQCPNQRVYFCYPTTGTATEGFRGYLFDDQTASSKLGARLFHSRAPVDFNVILNAEPEEDDAELQIASLQSWGTPVVCCTVDTVLGIMQNQRRGLYAWPALSQAAFVFDEIHAYDDKLFGSLLQFLDKLSGLRVLLMTASLPTPRLKAIEEILEEQDDELQIIRGPEELERLPRYRREQGVGSLFRATGNEQATEEFGVPAPRSDHANDRKRLPPSFTIDDELRQRVISEVNTGGRVLWICNVVDRAMAVADIFADVAPLIYHSRFRYEDRVEQHRAVVAAFDRNATNGCLAICTQVAEMSLDISATLLVSEICPVPSLIQRLGRLNRHAMPPEPGEREPPTLPFIIVEPTKEDGSLQVMPYAEKTYGDWPTQAREWLDQLGNNNISQQTLAAAWESLGADEEPPPLGNSTWIEGGPVTQIDSLRESSPGVTVVLPGDDAELVRNQKRELTRVAIPMPPPYFFDWKPWRTQAGYIVPPADSITYSKDRGAQWPKP